MTEPPDKEPYNCYEKARLIDELELVFEFANLLFWSACEARIIPQGRNASVICRGSRWGNVSLNYASVPFRFDL